MTSSAAGKENLEKRKKEGRWESDPVVGPKTGSGALYLDRREIFEMLLNR